MYLLIDESKSFIFPNQQVKNWGIALVVGVMLPYKARQLFLKKYSGINKQMRNDPVFVNKFLDDLITWKIQGVLITGDHVNVMKQEAERFRSDYFLKPLYDFADKEPEYMRAALRAHLDNLAGKGVYGFSLQDFFKVLIILETITALVQLYVSNVSNMRTIDLRQIKLIIDDQCKAALMTLKQGFIHFFLNCRSKDGRFNHPTGCRLFQQLYTNKNGNTTFLDSTKLLKENLIDEKGKMDDRYPELHIADILANLSTKLFAGSIPEELGEKLSTIFKVKDNLHFHPDKEFLDVTISNIINQNTISQFLSAGAN